MLSQSSSDIVLLAEAIDISSCIPLSAIAACVSCAGCMTGSVLAPAREAFAMAH